MDSHCLARSLVSPNSNTYFICVRSSLIGPRPSPLCTVRRTAMPLNRHAFRAALTLAGVVTLSLASTTSAAAAIVGSLSASEAQPGDRVTLQAQGPVGQTETAYLISTSAFERQIARF